MFVVNEMHSYNLSGAGDVEHCWLTLIVLQERGPMGLYIKQEILRPLSWLLSRSFLCVKG